jgi:ribonuclease P protein component
MQRFTFKKDERLCSKIVLDKLFTDGKSVFAYPFKYIFLLNEAPENPAVQIVFSVPKRNFKRAVHRNLIRRRMREAFRLNKPAFYESLGEQKIALMVIYTEKEILDFKPIQSGLIKGFRKITTSLRK